MSKRGSTVCAAMAMALSACNADPQDLRVLSRVGSPDGKRDAIYVENMSGDATVGPSEEVYVVQKGNFPRLADRAFKAERVCNLKIRWMGNAEIEVGYWANKPANDRSILPRPIGIRTKWLGSDPANGC
jgi:hypothetical protein